MLITLASVVNNYVGKAEKGFEFFSTKRRWLFYFLFSLLIISFNWVLLSNFDKTATGDFDYFAQAYEAIRKTLLEYHQFPWMNAWVSGGVPLYANPQVGVFSLQTILVILFGTLAGLKISLLIYSLLGFWSFYALVRRVVQARALASICLASIWIINGFFMSHYIGHYSFALFQLFPLLCYFALTITRPRHWLYLALTLSILTLSSLHYAVIQSLLALLLVAGFDFARHKSDRKQKIGLYAKGVLVFLVICGHRIFYTLDYAFDFPRIFADPANGISVLLRAFVLPPDPSKGIYDSLITPPSPSQLAPYAWGEFNAFVGIGVALAFVLSIIGVIYVKKRTQRRGLLFFLFAAFLFFVIAIGDFAWWSPHALVHLLPGFSGMRVASRWLIWVIFFGLIFIAYSLRYMRPKTLASGVKLLLVLGVFELLLTNTPTANVFSINVSHTRVSDASFEQFDSYDHFNQPTNLATYRERASLDRRYETYGFEGTLNDYGEVRGYEPLIDTRFSPTLRCGIDSGCPIVLSGNATVVKWSPNEIVLKRTDQKPIELNINPSNYWLVNGKRIFASGRVAEVTQKFTITNREKVIILTATPQLIQEAIYRKIDEAFSKTRKVIRNNFL